MEINYELTEKNYLDYYLFNAFQSTTIKSRRKKSVFFLTISFWIAAVYFYFQTNIFLTVYFGVFGFVTLLFYKKYYNWKHKKYYKKYIQDHKDDLIGKKQSIVFSDELIIGKSDLGESKLNVSEVNTAYELPELFVIKITSTTSFIIPKEAVSDISELKKTFTDLQIELTVLDNWKV